MGFGKARINLNFKYDWGKKMRPPIERWPISRYSGSNLFVSLTCDADP
jgi:hypothetical protein